MDDAVLQETPAGQPVMVTLRGEEYPLAYPMQAVILYKRETAALDRERKRASGRPALRREEKRELRERRRELLAEANGLRPEKGEPWDKDKWANVEELFAEAMTAQAALDQDVAAGDSLYNKGNWWKISPDGDPERLLLALWVGLHKFEGAGNPDVTYVESFTREQLGSLVDLSNGEELTAAISRALASSV